MLQSLNNLYQKAAHSSKGFLCFKKPGLPNLHCWSGPMRKIPFSDLSPDAFSNACIFSPFDITSDPCLLIQPDVILEDEEILSEGKNISTDQHNFSFQSHQFQIATKNQYTELVKQIRKAITLHQAQKVVAARCIQLPIPPAFDSMLHFMNLCAKYPNAFVYVLSVPGYAEWMGASPELLLKSDKHSVSTVSLAGSQAAFDNNSTYFWGEKELEEQAIVTRFITQKLSNCGLEQISQNVPYTHTAGHIAHLKTDISAIKPHTVSLQTILSALHPTPAVCGLPKEEAMLFIKQYENLQRSYYSGFLGLFKDESSESYVNIRCMMRSQNTLTLFAGCGVLADSDPEKEWLESEMKLQTMNSLLTSLFNQSKNG